jgi:hypothetical protein
MKMQLRKILIIPAIDDQTICRETKFTYEALNGGKQIDKKSCIRGIEFFQGSDGFLGQEQNMKWVGRLWVIKRHQGLCFVQTFHRDRKAHMRKDPAKEAPDPRVPYPLVHINL